MASYCREHPIATASIVGFAALAVSAVVNHRLARNAARRDPPRGQMLDIDGVRLHYVDRLVDTERQSSRLHREVAHSTFHAVAGAGHMVHQTDTGAVMAAIAEATSAAKGEVFVSTAAE